jgi:hypothetical protein
VTIGAAPAGPLWRRASLRWGDEVSWFFSPTALSHPALQRSGAGSLAVEHGHGSGLQDGGERRSGQGAAGEDIGPLRL